MRLRPLAEILAHGGVHDGIKTLQCLGVAEDRSCEIRAVEAAVDRIATRTELARQSLAQSGILVHKAFGSGIGVVNGDAAVGEKSADSALTAPDAAGNAYFVHRNKYI